MHVAASDLSGLGGSKPFTFRGITGPAAIRRELPDAKPHTADGTPSGTSVDAKQAPTGGAQIDLVRGVVEQIVGRSLRAKEIDALAERIQPVPLAFDHARKVQAIERARDARVRAEKAPAASASPVAWNATLDLRETESGKGAFAMTGALTTTDGREVAIDVHLVGDGKEAVLPLSLDVDLGPDGNPVRIGFSGHAVDAGSAPGTDQAAVSAAWAGMAVNVHEAAGSTVTTLGDLHVAHGGDLATGGPGHIDLVA